MQFWIVQLIELVVNQAYTHASTLLYMCIPWIVICSYWLYHTLNARRRRVSRVKLGPFITFYDALSNGASAGYDKTLLRVFHPELLREKKIERGLIRAMARYVHHTLGTFVSVDESTVCFKQDGLRVNCVALVNFSKMKHVKCQLSWVQRLPAAVNIIHKKNNDSCFISNNFPESTCMESKKKCNNSDEKSVTTNQHNIFNKHYESSVELEKWFAVDCTGRAALHTFHITGFHVTPSSHENNCDILPFIDIADFEPVAERFVELLFAHPPTEAVEMMISTLRNKYINEEEKNKISELESAIQQIVEACGGCVLDEHSIDCTLISKKVITANNNNNSNTNDKKIDSSDEIDNKFVKSCNCNSEENKLEVHNNKNSITKIVNKAKAIHCNSTEPQREYLSGLEMVYCVVGKQRNMEIKVCLTFEELRCCVVSYNIQAEPDRRTHVIHDHDSGQNVIVGEEHS